MMESIIIYKSWKKLGYHFKLITEIPKVNKIYIFLCRIRKQIKFDNLNHASFIIPGYSFGILGSDHTRMYNFTSFNKSQ